MYNWWFAAAGVGAAFAFATSTHLKHLSAGDVPDAQNLHPSALARFVRATVSHRLWLGGILADVVGLVLQITALHLGPLSAVQPLLILGLLFALLLRQGHHGRLRRAELGWAAVVVACLACVVVLAGTSSARTTPVADLGPAIAAGGVGVLLAAACVVLGRLQRGSGRSAALLGIAVGVIYASSAALLKAISDIGARDLLAVLWSWQLYTVVVVGALGLVLNQVAFQAGPLTASLPAISTVDPLLSIVIGVWVFDEHIRHGAEAGAVLAVLLTALGVGVIRLSRIAVDS